MRTACLVLIATAPCANGCGRIGFDEAARDAAAGDGVGKCDIASPFGGPVMIAGLSSNAADVTLRLQADELTGVFWSLRTGDGELFAAQRPELASPFTASILTSIDVIGAVDADPTVPADGSFIVFSSTRTGGAGGFDLYEAARVAGVYTSPMLIAALSTASNETTPTYSNAEAAMYFDSDVSGKSRIYRAPRSGPLAYGAAAEVTELASPDGEEFDIAPSSDGLTVYFRSSRPGGPGGGDIYVATRGSLAVPFGTATLVDNINDTTIDGPSFLSPDQCRLYFTSDRTGTPKLYVASR